MKAPAVGVANSGGSEFVFAHPFPSSKHPLNYFPQELHQHNPSQSITTQDALKMQRARFRRYLFSVPLTKHISLVPLATLQNPQRGLRQSSSKRGAIPPPPKKPKNKSDDEDYDDDPYDGDPYCLKVAWLPGDVFEMGPMRTITYSEPHTRKEKKIVRGLHKLLDLLFWVGVWNIDKVDAWVSGDKSETTATAHPPNFRDLHTTAEQNLETCAPSPNSKASDQNEESSNYNFIITPSEGE